MKQDKRDQKFKIMTNDTLDYKDDANRVHFSTLLYHIMSPVLDETLSQ